MTQSVKGSSTIEQILDFVPDAILGVDGEGEIVLANRQAEKLFGYRRELLLGETVEMLVPQRFRDGHPAHRQQYFAAPRTRPMGQGVELFARRRDGTEFPAEISLSVLELEGRTIAAAAVRDVSERAESEREQALQRQLDRARRLESVGQLAGGIAHDFNNILGVIMNYAEFVAQELEPGTRPREDVEEIQRSAQRAADLTRQLLIFSRREVAKPKILYLRDVIGELENLLQRALGERVQMETGFMAKHLPVEIDPSQLEQVLVNLAVNARDAMPEGGRLLIEIDQAELDEEYSYVHPDTEPGTYAQLKVSDTGVGMDAETVEHIFEPFFTTKSEGTGLGMATVYGIVTGAGGRIDIYSEPGIGTTVKIHLPIAGSEPTAAAQEAEAAYRASGEVVLLVEDEPEVRRMSQRILSKSGFQVLMTDLGSEALSLCADPNQRIDLLLTDVIMPEMLGTELVEKARQVRPDLRVLYMSGYSHDVLAPETMADSGESDFIEKPFSSTALLSAIGGLLREGAEGEG